MKPFTIQRDTRKRIAGQLTGRKMSRCIKAETREQAQAIFDEGWEALEPASAPAMPPSVPILDWAAIRRIYLSPEALALKRRTPALQPIR